LINISAIQNDDISIDNNKSEHERLKQTRISKMMTDFEASNSINLKEKEIRTSFAKLQLGDNISPPSEPETILAQYYELHESKTALFLNEKKIDSLELSLLDKEEYLRIVENKKLEAEQKVLTLSVEYEQLLEKNIADEEHHTSTNYYDSNVLLLKEKSELHKRQVQELQVDSLKELLAAKDHDILLLNNKISALNELASGTNVEALASSSGDKFIQTLSVQLQEYEIMKKRLLFDLKNRCKKVVELELLLENAKEENLSMRNNSTPKKEKQRYGFIEQQLQRLTLVQKTMIEQNETLRKDSNVFVKKLAARDERITKLENLIMESQNKLEEQAQGYTSTIQKMLEKANNSSKENNQWGNWMQSSKIAKPLRGGVITENECDNLLISPLSSPSKKSSWYVSLLKK
jgi:kinesin family protein 5